jgi:TonB family protein
MFTPIQTGIPQKSKWLRTSLALHLVLLVVFVFPRTPQYIKPKLILHGENGVSTVYVYTASASEAKTALPQKQMEENNRLTWQKPPKKFEKQDKKTLSRTPQEIQSSSEVPKQEPLAGSQYGSLAYGDTTGSEVRPAIRVSGSEPRVFPWDLANIAEGNIVVEVTIDEQGRIINKIVLQSLSPTIDQKVLAALEDWHFIPAMRDGEAIPSKQDVYYHYPLQR